LLSHNCEHRWHGGVANSASNKPKTIVCGKSNVLDISHTRQVQAVRTHFRKFAVRTLLLSIISGVFMTSSVYAKCAPALDFSFRPLAGKESVKLCEKHANQVLLVVNTASKCGYTPQYEGLEALHAKYASQGFAVIGFPSNEFGGQEPGTEKEIQEFCTLTYGVKFPMYEKTSVKGASATPFYQGLAKATGSAPAWNFHKYLIGADGAILKAYPSSVKPNDPQLLKDIDAALAARK
jgi:glutathione peroxidase